MPNNTALLREIRNYGSTMLLDAVNGGRDACI